MGYTAGWDIWVGGIRVGGIAFGMRAKVFREVVPKPRVSWSMSPHVLSAAEWLALPAIYGFGSYGQAGSGAGYGPNRLLGAA